jgi:putative acetyltransferase
VAEQAKLGKPKAGEPKVATVMIANARGGSMSVLITLESPEQEEVRALLAQSDAYHAGLYPAESNHLLPASELARENVRFLVARIDGSVVGCGALLLGEHGEAEIKRMFVVPSARGRRLGRALLLALEDAAIAAGIGVIRLETGVKQVPALALYRSQGYGERGPFGSYREDPLSAFFEKRIGPGEPGAQ